MDNHADILSRILHLFKQFGIKSVTMDDISRELGMSKKTLYTLVSDKNELVHKVAEFEFNNMNEAFSRVFNKEGLNAVEQLIEVNYFMRTHLKYHSTSFDYDLRKYYPDVYNSFYEKKEEAMYSSVLENMLKGKKEGIYRADLNEEIIARLYISRIMQTTRSRHLSIEDFIAPENYREYFVYHIRGIANEKGIEILENNIHKLDHTENQNP